MKIKNALSCFDGISCGRVALDNAKIEYDTYYASEIDKQAIKVAQKNHPTTVQLGNIEDWKKWDLKNIDLIMGGSPCQGFSSAGKGLNFNDPRSKLFFTFIDIIKHYKPKYFLLENVGMKPAWIKVISKYMGVTPIEINSNLLSAQNRRRLYWCNWDVATPQDKQIKLSSILETNKNWSPANISGRRLNSAGKREDYNKSIPYTQCIQVKKKTDKMGCLTTVEKDAIISNLPHGRYTDAYNKYTKGKDWRNLTPIECERLQTLPDNYTQGISDSRRKSVIGNGWTVDVITHIFEELVKKESKNNDDSL